MPMTWSEGATAVRHRPRAQRVGPTADRWPFFAYLLLLVALPLPLGGNHGWAWALLGGSIIVLSLAWLWGYARGETAAPPTWRAAAPVGALLALFLTWAWLQLLPLPHAGAWSSPLSLDPIASRDHLLQGVSYLCLFVLTVSLVRDRERVRAVLVALVVGGVLQATYGALMTLSGLEYGFLVEKDAYRGFATGTFVNRNHLAGYLEMTLAAGLGLMLGLGRLDTHGSRRAALRGLLQTLLGGKLVLRMALVVMVIGLILTHSRMGNTAFMTTLLVCGALWLLAVTGVSRARAAMFLLSVLAVDVLLVGSWFGFERVVDRLSHTSLAQESRDEAFGFALAYLRDHWMLGSGGGTFYTVFPSYVGAFIGYYDHAHNDYVELLAEYGLPGLLTLGGAVTWGLVSALQVVWRGRDPLLRGAALAAFGGMFALLFHGWLDFNLQIPANAATFVVLLALAGCSRALSGQSASRPGDPCTTLGR